MANPSFLRFERPRGDVHIKSGGMVGESLYVMKIASGFYDNPTRGWPSGHGMMLLFAQESGALEAILLDEGYLTDLRTGLAGAIAAKHLARHPIDRIGIVGSGAQAREQLFHLQWVTDCREVLVWGRDLNKAQALAHDPWLALFDISVAECVEEVADRCGVIVTATSASRPLLFGEQLRPGVHVTAVGADDRSKQELDVSVLSRADWVVADSLLQCAEYGELVPNHKSFLKNV